VRTDDDDRNSSRSDRHHAKNPKPKGVTVAHPFFRYTVSATVLGDPFTYSDPPPTVQYTNWGSGHIAPIIDASSLEPGTHEPLGAQLAYSTEVGNTVCAPRAGYGDYSNGRYAATGADTGASGRARARCPVHATVPWTAL
jgi:hypothetical protein